MTGENIEVHYHEEIYRLMTVDGLTQIFNRRYFNEALEREFNRSKRYARDLSLVVFDIDHFKRVNDTYGHLAGDNLLRQIAAAVKPRLRREDIFARTGGEEFGMLLARDRASTARAHGGEGAADSWKKPRPSRSTSNVVPLHHEPRASRCSADDGRRRRSYTRRADEHLYEAKQGGRNRVAGLTRDRPATAGICRRRTRRRAPAAIQSWIRSSSS